MSEIFQDDCKKPLIACFALAGLFVGSLYVWDSKQGRNHPSTIKKRFFSVFVVILVSPFFLKLFLTSPRFEKFTVFEILGFRLTGLLPALILPLLLTMVLFLGPLCTLGKHELRVLFNAHVWFENFRDLLWVRNIIVGPLAEEFSFRACMMPVLLQCYQPLTAAYICSVFFGIAHSHHGWEMYKAGESLKVVMIGTFLQFCYTTMFGAYSAYVFFQTGHFISVFIIHSFCNIMALPDLGSVFLYENPKKTLLILVHVLGLALWFLLMKPMLDPKYYDNYVYYS